MVEVLIVKLPDGTKAALKKVAQEGGYMHLSDLLRDWIRQGLIAAKTKSG
jgi:hypothetical protein